MERCGRLKDYSLFVAEVNYYIDQDHKLSEALNLAINACIEKNILNDILLKHRGEVIHMLMTKHNVKWYEKLMIEEAKKEARAEAIAEGRAEGLTEGLAQGRKQEKIEIAQKLFKKGIPVEEIVDATGLAREEIENLD
jgi:predicted transposase/invertase (TIGR01784 family)